MGDALSIEREYQRLKNKTDRTMGKFEKKDKQPGRDNFEERVESFASRAKRIGKRADNYFKDTREGRLISYSVAIAWSTIFLIFFNFFYQYIAYYHYETINNVGRWVKEPLLTEKFNAVLLILSITLVLSIVGNFILIVFDRYILRQVISIILHLFGLVTILIFLFVFPFNFNVVPVPFATRILSFVVALVFIGISLGFIISMVVKVVKLVIALVKRI